MKAIITLVILLFIVTTAVSSAVLYMNENYILSASLCISTVLSVSFCIHYADVTLVTSENHTA